MEYLKFLKIVRLAEFQINLVSILVSGFFLVSVGVVKASNDILSQIMVDN